MTRNCDEIVQSFCDSVRNAKTSADPYRHWFLKNCVPSDVVEEIGALPMEAPDLAGVSGKRELHNKTRNYFDVENQSRFGVVKAFSEAFQSKRVTDLVREAFGAHLDGSYLRIEYAQDTDGFWLEPHTDLGVKMFTMLLYVSQDPEHSGLGTDIYDGECQHAGRSPFEPGGAMIFVPSDSTYHGFEPRPIKGIRKSVIINYVTNEWRAREQLAYPQAPIN